MASQDTPLPLASHAQMVQEAALLHRQGRLQDAERSYRAALELQPDHFATLYYLGLLYVQQGRAEAAIPLLRQALTLNSQIAEVHNNLGVALQALGRYEEAVSCYEQALAITPRYAMAHSNLGATLAALGRHDAAISRFDQALVIEPGNAEVLRALGLQYVFLGRHSDAFAYFSKAVAARPDFAEAKLNLGNTLLALQRPSEALDIYKEALTLQPRSVLTLLLLGDVLKVLNRPEEAIAHFEQALLLEPDCIEAQMKLGNLQQLLGRHRGAIAAYQRAIAIMPNDAQAYDALGFALAEFGDGAGARRAFEAALRLEPRRTKSYYGLVSAGKLTHADPHLGAMKHLALELQSLSSTERMFLHFALGKALADAGDQPQSFAQIVQANALRRSQIEYDEAAVLALFERIRAVFTAELMRSKSTLGHPSRKPIFILGMARSGSTLVEQLLASHPQVFAAGERQDLTEAATEVLRSRPGNSAFPEFVPELTQELLQEIGAAYLGRLEAAERLSGAPRAENDRERRRAEYITDKLPANFVLVGLIHLVLPNARIIHTARDPVDTCLSCFSTLFTDQPHTNELGELGRYYRGYASLMAHWRQVLPAGAFLDVQYEQLVGNFESEARRIIAYCGLDWHEACLNFHRTERPIRTASMAQARQPIYQTSIGRYRPDAAQLRPLMSALGLE